MKRSSCLSALLVGLSLTTATAALAAPPAGTDTQSPKKLALAQGDSSPTPAPSSAPSPSGASTEESTQQPAVSVGTSTAPATDTPAQPAAEPEKKPAPRPWAGSSLGLYQNMTTNTIFRGQTQYSNPTTESSLWLLPRYSINEAWQLRGRLIVTYEETNSDSTTYRNEPLLGDTTVSLFYRKIPKLPLGISPALGLNVGAPTSKSSQARTVVFTPGATLQLAKPIEHFLGGELLILTALTYSHPVYRSRNPEVRDPRPPGALTCVGGGNCSDLLSGSMNTSDSLSYTLMLAAEWGKWNPALFYLGGSQWAYSPTEAKNPVDGKPLTGPDGWSPTTVRQSHYFSAWLDYNFNSWLTGEIGYQHSTSALNDSGQRANPFFNRLGGDTRVYLGASVQLDNLVKAIQGGNDGEAGIVRAKAKSPTLAF